MLAIEKNPVLNNVVYVYNEKQNIDNALSLTCGNVLIISKCTNANFYQYFCDFVSFPTVRHWTHQPWTQGRRI